MGDIRHEWYLYIENTKPLQVFGGPGSREAAVSRLVQGSVLTNFEQNKIKCFLQEDTIKLGEPLLVVGHLSKKIPDKMVMRILGPWSGKLDNEADLLVADDTKGKT